MKCWNCKNDRKGVIYILLPEIFPFTVIFASVNDQQIRQPVNGANETIIHARKTNPTKEGESSQPASANSVEIESKR